jgi:O-methyltransferase
MQNVETVSRQSLPQRWLRAVASSFGFGSSRGSPAVHDDLRRAIAERDDARQKLSELRAQLNLLQGAMRPFPGYEFEKGLPEWVLPPGPHLAATPQRYVENFPRYLDRGGGMRPEDIRGFIDATPQFLFDRARFFQFSLIGDQIAKDGLTGDVAELGVWIGATASILSRIAHRQGRIIYLLDTFEGFPQRDLVGDDSIFKAEFGDTSLEVVRERVPGDHVRIIKGYFPESAVQLPDSASFCLVHLDCDLRRPFESGLRYFWPRLVPGGFLIMHDYGSLYWEGLEKAVDEFFADRPESIVPVPDWCGSVVVRKAK